MFERQELFLPTLHTFENNNIFTGSWGELRYKVTPEIVMATPKEVNLEESSMKAQCWHGPLCFEKSEIEAEATFPMSPQGREAMFQWIKEHA